MMSSETRSPDLTIEARALRGPDSWVLAAFLALFSVAIAAAMPQISVAVRAAVDASKPGQGQADAKDRNGVRVRGLIVRAAVTPQPFGGTLAVLPPLSAAVATPFSPRATAHLVDFAAQIRTRGVAARAPPAQSA